MKNEQEKRDELGTIQRELAFLASPDVQAFRAKYLKRKADHYLRLASNVDIFKEEDRLKSAILLGISRELEFLAVGVHDDLAESERAIVTELQAMEKRKPRNLSFSPEGGEYAPRGEEVRD